MTARQPTPRVTIADVAQAAGVSRTTVSHALNGRGQVDPRTIERVHDAAAQLNYRPSVRAQRLRSGRSYAIALLSSMSPAVSAGPSQLGFFTELAMGCARTALLRRYVLVLAPPLEDRNPLNQLDIDGAVLLEPLPRDPLASELAERSIPYVSIDGPDSATSVELHHHRAAELLVNHLLERGARSIGLLLGSSGRRSQDAFRDEYLRAVRRAGIEPVVHYADESQGESAGLAATTEMLHAHPSLDALCVPIDAFATGAATAATAAGYALGHDMLIATRYDGLRARTNVPPLTAVDLNLDTVSGLAVDRLLALIGHDSSAPQPQDHDPSMTCATPTLVVRESTQP